MNNPVYNKEEFYHFLKSFSLSEKTIKSCLDNVRRFLALEQFNEHYEYTDILSYLSKLSDSNVSRRTKRVYLSSIKRYYDYLIEKGVRITHPCRTLYIKGKENRDIIHHELLTMDELEQMMNREERYPSHKIRNQVIISLMIYQGLQISELEKLKLYHLDLDAGILNVPSSKTLLRRSLELHRTQYNLFFKYLNKIRPLEQKEPQDALILNKKGNPITSQDIRFMISSMVNMFPYKKLNPTTIRKSVISYWLNVKKIPLEQVQLMAGHKWISSTERYRHRDNDSERELINRWFPGIRNYNL